MYRSKEREAELKERAATLSQQAICCPEETCVSGEFGEPVEPTTDEFESMTKEELAGQCRMLTKKLELLTNNLNSAYQKTRDIEKFYQDKTITERATDSLISQATSVFSNTIMLAIKNKQ